MDSEDYIFVMFALFIVFFIVIGILSAISLNDIGASKGEHTGFVTAVEFNENVLWDANLVYFKTDTESTQEDIYCVNDELIKSKLKSYAKTKSQITINYENPFWFWRSLCNGGSSIIIGVEKYETD